MTSKMSRKQRVYELLAYGGGEGWVSTVEICHPAVGGTEGGRRLRELRADGHDIEKRPKAGSDQFEYRLRPKGEQ